MVLANPTYVQLTFGNKAASPALLCFNL